MEREEGLTGDAPSSFKLKEKTNLAVFPKVALPMLTETKCASILVCSLPLSQSGFKKVSSAKIPLPLLAIQLVVSKNLVMVTQTKAATSVLFAVGSEGGESAHSPLVDGGTRECGEGARNILKREDLWIIHGRAYVEKIMIYIDAASIFFPPSTS